MARTKTLQSQLRDVALDYMKQVAKLLNRDLRDCHWVGTDDHERGIYTICDLGDITFLTLDQMQVIIDRLPDWLRRYGTTKAVAQEIDDWMEWSIQEENWLNGHPRINLEHWLMGCPRERLGIGHEFDSIKDTEAGRPLHQAAERRRGMKNAIIINGTTYELVPNDTDEMVCESCALRDICMSAFAFNLCEQFHNAEYKDHYVKRQKGGES